jgi:NADPH2:quinone reductase
VDESSTYTRTVVGARDGSEVLGTEEVPLRPPGANEVRVRVLVSGVSYADVLMRKGVHPETPDRPFTPGWDLIGEVDAVGAAVADPPVGTRVAALPVVGANAEYAYLPPDDLVPVPDGLDPVAALPLVFNYVTAFQMLHRLAALRPGQRALVHGAAGGIGTALLELGRLARLDRYGTASRPKHGVVASFGATPIDYRNEDFVDRVRVLTGGGVDVVFDGVGGRHLWRSRAALQPGGLVVAYGLSATLSSGRPRVRHRFRGLPTIAAAVALSRVLPGRRRVEFYSVQRRRDRRPDEYRADLGTLFELSVRGRLDPLVERLPPSEVAEAHRRLESGDVRGKLVLVPDGG